MGHDIVICQTPLHAAVSKIPQVPVVPRHYSVRMRTSGLGRAVLATAAACFAIYMLRYGDFAPAGQSLPAWLPGRQVWVYGSALLLLAASAGLCFSRAALMSTLAIVAYLIVWAAIGVPQILAQPISFGGWYGFCEALSSLVGAWIVYTWLRSQSSEGSVHVAQVLFGVTCVFYGGSHFAYAAYTAGMVPAYLPGRLAWAYLTGAGHVAAGQGIIFRLLPALAATLEAIMMSLFGLLVWVPSFFANPRPDWATPPQTQWSELIVNVILAAAAGIVAMSLRQRPRMLASASSA
jgi:hypothetical protein